MKLALLMCTVTPHPALEVPVELLLDKAYARERR